jgi:hypothetical protein
LSMSMPRRSMHRTTPVHRGPPRRRPARDIRRAFRRTSHRPLTGLTGGAWRNGRSRSSRMPHHAFPRPDRPCGALGWDDSVRAGAYSFYATKTITDRRKAAVLVTADSALGRPRSASCRGAASAAMHGTATRRQAHWY